MHEVVLCADEETIRDPSLIGLDGEILESQQWLHPISSAFEARDYLRSRGSADEVWVASSNEVDPINLAAALKRDCTDKTVRLVAWRESGSLMSRASAAGIDEVMGYREMAARYAGFKGRQASRGGRRRTPQTVAAERLGAEPTDGATRRLPSCTRFEGGGFEDGPDLFASRYEAMEPQVRHPPAQLHETQPMQRVSASGAGNPEVAPPPPGSSQRGYALSVVSASGGTGKSTVAVLSALLAAHHGYRTVIIDADLQFGDVVLMMGDEGCLPVDRVVADPRCLDEAKPPKGRPAVVSAPERMEQFEIYLPQLPGVIDRARESFDVVIVNTGSFWTESHVQLMECCSNTLFLMDQRPTSVKAARRALELCSRCGVASHPFLFAVNRCSRNSLLSSIDISCALNGVSVSELKDGGRTVAELTGSGMAARLVEERNDLCVSLNDFLGGVIPAALGGAEDTVGAGRKARRSPFRRRRKVACL